ncbi:unnamed protein product, partial [Closterium sp. NIES-65]
MWRLTRRLDWRSCFVAMAAEGRVAATETFASPEYAASFATTSGSPVHIRVARRICGEKIEENSSFAAPVRAAPASPAVPASSPTT